ncbi:MAG: C25 family cysteine peptidase, partial [Deltaproteobacteria bacterium]|nr:C25 family cysteine peptidase [Deltaproteobacteria bacterium]
EHLGFGGESEYAKNSKEEIRLGSDAHGYHTSGFEDSLYAEFFITHYTEIPGCTAPPPPLYDYDWSGHDWPKSVLIDFINNGNCGYPGVQILNHLGHANYTYCMKLYTSDLPSLNNNDRYFFAYSQGCLPGGFDHTDCFAEEITSMEHGAFAVIMNARYGWGTYNSTDGPSQRYDRPFWDAVLDHDIFQLAKANAYSKEHFNAIRIDEDCMRWCYYELNLFGDPELNIITGAGLLHDSHAIDDDNSGESSGNANGLVEPGETIEMPVTLRNYLQAGVTNVTAVLSTTDPYVTIISNTQSFGNIPAGGVATSAGNYVFSVDPSSDAHVTNFHLDIIANEGSWSTDFAEEVHKEPDITVSPGQFEVTVPPGGITTRTLTIGNVGLEELNWSIDSIPSLSQLMPTGSGGPDAYGYYWTDSDEAGGPTYNWVEISDIGTEIILSDDDYEEVSLPFAFDFYGVDKTSVKISSNGYLTFGTDGTDWGNDPIPHSNDPDDFIAPFWDDLNPRSGAQGHIYYYYDESNSRFIVEYKEVQHYYSGNPETFEVILYPNSSILYQYQALSYVTSSTVGIENSDASTGLQVVYNSSYLHNELAVRISSGVDWLGFQPESDTVAPGGASNVNVTFDAAGLTEGTYEANIFVNSNDPDESQVAIPATLHVGFTPPPPPEAKPMPWLFLLLD